MISVIYGHLLRHHRERLYPTRTLNPIQAERKFLVDREHPIVDVFVGDGDVIVCYPPRATSVRTTQSTFVATRFRGPRPFPVITGEIIRAVSVPIEQASTPSDAV